MTMTEKVVKVHESLPEDRFLMEGIDDSGGPLFTVSEVGKVFFNRSPHWVRLQEKEGLFSLDGEPLKISRSEGKVGVRQFALSDIEKVAHGLAQAKRIDGSQLTHCLLAVKAIAGVWGYFP